MSTKQLSTKQTSTESRLSSKALFLKKAIAAVAVAGSLAFVAAPAYAGTADGSTRTAVTTVDKGTTADADAAAAKVFSDLQSRVSSDPALANALRSAAARGDTVSSSRLVADQGAQILAIGSTESAQTNSVTIVVHITVCVKVFGGTYCGSVTVTVNLS